MKTALITGTSQRLGLFLTDKLLKAGWHVHAITRDASPQLDSLASPSLTVHKLGQYRHDQVVTLINQLKYELTTLDLLINNASIYASDEHVSSLEAHFYESLFFIHMQLPALLMQNLEEQLVNAEGCIVSITDIYADNPNAGYSLYCSTKAGLQNLTLGFAKKLAPKVRVNCIQPGPIKFLDEHDEEHKAQIMRETLLASEGGFDPVFQTLQFILDNTYLTGTCINVDGGRSLIRS